MIDSPRDAAAAPREFDFTGLRRFPDVEADNLFASDASDRLILDTAAEALAAAGADEVVVLGDNYGALTLGAAAMFGVAGIRVFQDSLIGEHALVHNAKGMSAAFRSLPDALEESSAATLLGGATVVLMQLPRSLAELDELAGLIAENADPSVVVFAGGRVKHMTTAMNDVLLSHFGSVDVSHARQKSRVLTARTPIIATNDWPHRERHSDIGLTIAAHGGVFAGTKLDIGTRLLLEVMPDAVPAAATIIDLGCGTGVLAAALARDRPEARVIASDISAAAVASARATAEANGQGDRVTVVRDVGLASRADASADLIVLNPPFHSGATVHTGLAESMFAEAARVLKPGGELWTVFNSSLAYRPSLAREVGPTRQVARTAKFTVTASTRSSSRG